MITGQMRQCWDNVLKFPPFAAHTSYKPNTAVTLQKGKGISQYFDNMQLGRFAGIPGLWLHPLAEEVLKQPRLDWVGG